MLALLFLALNLGAIVLVGEYLVRLHRTVQGSPRYIVRSARRRDAGRRVRDGGPDPRRGLMGRCNCRSAEDMTQELEYQPSSYFINEYARPVLACSQCRDKGGAGGPSGRPDRERAPGAWAPGWDARAVDFSGGVSNRRRLNG